jgi:hypothetical protein
MDKIEKGIPYIAVVLKRLINNNASKSNFKQYF